MPPPITLPPGLWPDVGFAWRAARLSSPAAGLYLALTGARVSSASDLLWLGIATHYCPSSQIHLLLEDLEASPSDADAVISKRCVAAAAAAAGGTDRRLSAAAGGAPGPLQRLQSLLERCFGPLLYEGGYAKAGLSEARALQLLVERLERVSS